MEREKIGSLVIPVTLVYPSFSHEKIIRNIIVGVSFQPGRGPGKVNQQTVEDISGIGTSRAFSCRGTSHLMKLALAAQFLCKIKGSPCFVLIQERTMIAHRLTLDERLPNEASDNTSFHRDWKVVLSLHNIWCWFVTQGNAFPFGDDPFFLLESLEASL
ncbi:MAG: hypothetical protein Q3M30_16240 [Candidatus Electrothrix sp. Rat3]|nr:hypothetical protein [Candidatus Electrothrix rattekaaiensis]